MWDNAPVMSQGESDFEARLAQALDEPDVSSAYLFGSHAEGRAHRESDVDVGVLFDPSARRTTRERFESSLVLSSQLQAALGTSRVDVVVLNDAPPRLARRVVTTGRRLVCAQPDVDHDFVRDVQLRAADIEPFLRRTRRVKLASLAR